MVWYDRFMKKKLLPLLTIFFIYGCGYSSNTECRVKELQECNSEMCEIVALRYCDNLFAEKEDRKDKILDYVSYAFYGIWALIFLGSVAELFKALLGKDRENQSNPLVYVGAIGIFVLLTYLMFFK